MHRSLRLPPALALLVAPLVVPLLACGDGDGGTSTDTAASNTAVTITPTTGTGDPSGPSSAPEPTDTASPTSAASDSGTTTEASTDASTTSSTSTTEAASATETTDPSSTDSSSTGTTGEPLCPEGQLVCEGDIAKVCDGMGGFSSEEACEGVCAPDKGCLLCAPGTSVCEGEQVQVCNSDGDGYEPGDSCDPLLGLSCDAEAGACAGACAALGLSYIGCEYFPTVLQQFEGYSQAPTYEYAVAVANTTQQVAKVTVTRGPNMVAQVDVAANSVQILKLPWITALSSGFAGSNIVPQGAYRLRSTQPVTVYQYNPLAATVTNDASLLLPVNTWTGNYLVAAWPTWPFGGQQLPGIYAVVARQNGTKVVLKPSATGKVVKPGGGVAADGTGTIMLDEGDVLQVFSNANGDVTGSIVEADKPVQVFGAHKCTNVPLNVTACDHLEESMFPIETLAKEYVVAPPVQVPNNNLEKGQVVRIIASEDDTTLVFNPDQPGNKLLAKAGDFLEIPTTIARFVVTADKRILVSQYMVGGSGGFGASDPAMVLAVSPAQWRKSYLFHAATSWQANFVDIIATKGANVTVDDVNVAAWLPIGATNYQIAHVNLANNGNGNHKVASDVGVGIGVYGVQSFGSYWYPGGLDLDVLPQ